MKQLGNFTYDEGRLVKLCQDNDISYLALFGSYLRGTNSPDSDVDLLIKFSKDKSLLDIVRTQTNFSRALGKEVDLVEKDYVSPYLKDIINNSAVTIYEQ